MLKKTEGAVQSRDTGNNAHKTQDEDKTQTLATKHNTDIYKDELHEPRGINPGTRKG